MTSVTLRARLAKLEAAKEHSAKRYGRGNTGRGFERLFHAMENDRREAYGEELLPDLEYTQEDYEDDLRFIREHIPALRLSPGWQSEEGQQMLDAWEHQVREQIEVYRKEF